MTARGTTMRRGGPVTLHLPSLRSVAARHMDNAIFVPARHVDAPRIAAHFAVLNEAAMDVGLDVDVHLLSAKRTRDQEVVRHSSDPTAMLASRSECQCYGARFLYHTRSRPQ